MTDEAIGREYGTTGQAVNKALVLGGYRRTGYVKLANEIIPWDVKTTKGKLASGEASHHNTYPCKMLRAYMRSRLGDETITDANRLDASRFETRLRRDRVVLDYAPETGFRYVKREARDRDLIMRWPADVDLPTEPEHIRAVTLDSD
ncbi:hypothetical protein AB0A77_08105 [Streptomyces varsoviensis]|uniref:hypothetical protein n=1 Tax=Streptomyces varsoviensis TaxID=67373 RepID=UPI0033E10723